MSNSSVFVFYLYLYLYLHHPTILEAALKKKNSCVLHFYRTQVSLGSDLWVWAYVSPRLCADLTDVTLADEDSNSLPSDDVNRAILGNMAMQVAPPGGQNCN